jgi:hypothetical protein
MLPVQKGIVLMTKKIDRIDIQPQTTGFMMYVNRPRPTPQESFAYSNLDDLLMGLGEMLTVGVDLADPASDTSIEHVQPPDGSSSTTWTKRDGSTETVETGCRP